MLFLAAIQFIFTNFDSRSCEDETFHVSSLKTDRDQNIMAILIIYMLDSVMFGTLCCAYLVLYT